MENSIKFRGYCATNWVSALVGSLPIHEVVITGDMIVITRRNDSYRFQKSEIKIRSLDAFMVFGVGSIRIIHSKVGIPRIMVFRPFYGPKILLSKVGNLPTIDNVLRGYGWSVE